MIDFMSSWVKGLGLAIVIVSILEMLLPNNKTKKYIRMVMGIYILFTMISPFVSNKEKLNLNEFNLEQYGTVETSTNLQQNSMEDRIEQIYIQELEKDVTKKLEEQGYEVTNCNVQAKISDTEEETKIEKITLSVKKQEENKEESKQERNLENELVVQIQKIKPIDTSIKNNSNEVEETTENNENDKSISKSDIQNIKKFLIQEYGVNEKCLVIN